MDNTPDNGSDAVVSSNDARVWELHHEYGLSMREVMAECRIQHTSEFFEALRSQTEIRRAKEFKDIAEGAFRDFGAYNLKSLRNESVNYSSKATMEALIDFFDEGLTPEAVVERRPNYDRGSVARIFRRLRESRAFEKEMAEAEDFREAHPKPRVVLPDTIEKVRAWGEVCYKANILKLNERVAAARAAEKPGFAEAQISEWLARNKPKRLEAGAAGGLNYVNPLAPDRPRAALEV